MGFMQPVKTPLEELRAGVEDVRRFANLGLRLNGKDSPPLLMSSSSNAPGAPYSRPSDGKVRMTCVNWEKGCTVPTPLFFFLCSFHS